MELTKQFILHIQIYLSLIAIVKNEYLNCSIPEMKVSN